ncbi:hypothetical protein JNK13_12065 [bacterium]|nr:hypothetical protein [bacterium]
MNKNILIILLACLAFYSGVFLAGREIKNNFSKVKPAPSSYSTNDLANTWTLAVGEKFDSKYAHGIKATLYETESFTVQYDSFILDSACLFYDTPKLQEFNIHRANPHSKYAYMSMLLEGYIKLDQGQQIIEIDADDAYEFTIQAKAGDSFSIKRTQYRQYHDRFEFNVITAGLYNFKIKYINILEQPHLIFALNHSKCPLVFYR